MLPSVSIVMSTYNRSNIIGYSIQTVIAQEFSDWELIVVGDACTDDTEAVVARYNDPRIRFVNLEKNFGEQSYPNNYGAGLCKGKYLAFLNHDDLWFPDHLSVLVDQLEKNNADFVASWLYVIKQKASEETIVSYCPDDMQLTETAVPASCWLVKMEAYKKVGDWTPYFKTALTPSQEWIWRAQKTGIRMFSVKHLSVIAITSGNRKNSYKDRLDTEHKEVFNRLSNDPRYREELLSKALDNFGNDARNIQLSRIFKKLLRFIFYKSSRVLNESPKNIQGWIRFRRKGSFIRKLRENRGLNT